MLPVRDGALARLLDTGGVVVVASLAVEGPVAEELAVARLAAVDAAPDD
ncbi:MAG: hypothetical protein LWW86_12925 [Micrococcales bacterium]|nr:hypothetical protein [Micrococcales bacterium]